MASAPAFRSLALLALMGTVLAGCGSSSSTPEQANSASASPSAQEQVATEASPEEQAEGQEADSEETFAQAEGEIDPSATPATCATPSLEAVEAHLPEGHRLILAPNNGLNLAIPESWLTVAASAEDGEAQITAYLEATGMAGANTSMVESQLEQLDVLASAPEVDDKGYRDNISVYKTAMSAPCPPSEETLNEEVGKNYGSPVEYKSVATPLGEAQTQSYMLTNTLGIPAYGQLIAVPLPVEGYEYAMINISTLDEAKTAELAEAVLQSVQVNK